jgi:iron-sulfur cluster repair protein YtfE (RIC family)
VSNNFPALSSSGHSAIMHKIKDMMHAHQDKKRANEGVNDVGI